MHASVQRASESWGREKQRGGSMNRHLQIITISIARIVLLLLLMMRRMRRIRMRMRMTTPDPAGLEPLRALRPPLPESID